MKHNPPPLVLLQTRFTHGPTAVHRASSSHIKMHTTSRMLALPVDTRCRLLQAMSSHLLLQHVEVKKFKFVLCLSYKWPINDTNLSMSSVWQFSNDRKTQKVNFYAFWRKPFKKMNGGETAATRKLNGGESTYEWWFM